MKFNTYQLVVLLALLFCDTVCIAQDNIIVQTGWQGAYKEGKRYGDWKYFTAEGRIATEASYINDTLNGPYQLYDSVSGNKLLTGGFYKGDKHGEWKEYYNGTVVYTARYSYGNLSGYFAYYDSMTGAKKTEGFYSHNKLDGQLIVYRNDGINYARKILYSRDKMHGEARYYDSLSNLLIVKGNYYMDKKNGKWEYYYPGSGKLSKTEEYKNGLLHGAYIVYDSVTEKIIVKAYCEADRLQGRYTVYYSSGLIKLDMFYHNGLLDGESSEYYNTGKLEARGLYKNGYRTGTWNYYNQYNDKPWITLEHRRGMKHGDLYCYFPDGKVKRKHLFKNDEHISGICYNDRGVEIPCDELATIPEFPEDVMNFIGRNLIYSHEMIRNKAEGKVKVGFTINKHGNIENVNVVEGLNDECDAEAVRVISLMHGWSPMTIDNMPIDSYQVLPVVFWVQSE